MELEAKTSAANTQLDADLRFVRNIRTLTPFQKATHERLVGAVRTMAKRIMQVRLEIAKLECHAEVLRSDMEAESRTWSEAKRVALRAATETLQMQSRGEEQRVPRTIISFPERVVSPATSMQDLTGRKRSSSSHRPDSTADSFHSALDFSEDLSSSGYLRVETSSQGSTTSVHSDPDRDRQLEPDSVGAKPHTPSSHERFYTALENPEPAAAEEWDKTSAAKRVSLVRVPSTYAMRRFSSATRTTREVDV
jgi:hypothetical protein